MSSVVPPRITQAFADRYLLERELGRGGMATVYLGRDRKHDRRVAIKVLRPELASVTGAGRFLREVGITARLQHPHILTLIDSGEFDLQEDGRSLFYVMPYVEGESLQQRIVREGALPVQEAVRLLREVVEALAYAHRAGVLHRDIKPANVMLSDGHALVVDFGIARALGDAAPGETLTGTGLSIGTPEYMAPEQALGETLDHRADIYAVGVLAYEMFTGKPPFSGSPQSVLSAHVTRTVPSAKLARPDLPVALAAIIERCLAKRPEERFAGADALIAALDEAVAPAPAAAQRRHPLMFAGAAGVVLLLILGLTAMLARERRQRWVHEEAIPTIQRLLAAGDRDSALVVARRAEAIAPGDPSLEQLWRHVAYRVRFDSEPAGARVYRASLHDTSRWELLGTTPTDSVHVPKSMARYRFELSGHHPREILAGGHVVGEDLSLAIGGAPFPRIVRLMREDSPHQEMVYVPGPPVGGLQAQDSPRLAEFLIDRHEVTNREFMAFVQAGGYERQEFWTEEFVLEGRRLSWPEAMRQLVDATGQPGPATWRGGAPRAGDEDLPVGGVSWYEAAAYARFVGKSLPTLPHWQAAAVRSAAGYILPGSNFESDGPRRGITGDGMSPWGVFDIAGNLREWLVNEGDEGKRLLMGGGWSDPRYRFTDDLSSPPFAREVLNGMRLARYPLDDPVLGLASRPYRRAFRDYAVERPIGRAELERMQVIFDYDPDPLNARVEARDSSHADWIRERVSFDAAYRGERVTAILFLPRRHAPPYQTVVVFPGSNALVERTSDVVDGQEFAHLIRSGRAVLVPVYRGMWERGDGSPIETNATIAYRDAVVAWGQDLRRSIDYLATRVEIDTARLGYFGISMGGRLGGIMMVIESRLKAAVLFVAGLSMLPARPEVDVVNYLPQVSIPVLMLNGRYDDGFPRESSQLPFFRYLGTPPEHKRHLEYDDAHTVPRVELIRQSLAWLDRYLGPVGSSRRP